MRRILPGIATLTILAACMEGVPADAPDAPPPASPSNSCGANQLQDRIGKSADLQDFSAYEKLRMLGPDSMMTMDYRGDRLNVGTDSNGVITRIWCG